MCRRFDSLSIIKVEWWDRHEGLRGFAMVGFLIFALVTAIALYQASEGIIPFRRALLPIGVSIFLLVAVPRKLDLVAGAALEAFILSLIGAFLHRGGGTFWQYVEVV